MEGKRLCPSLFFDKVVDLRPATLLEKRLQHRCFPMDFAKPLRTPFHRTPPEDCFCNFDVSVNSVHNFSCFFKNANLKWVFLIFLRINFVNVTLEYVIDTSQLLQMSWDLVLNLEQRIKIGLSPFKNIYFFASRKTL